MLEICKCLYCGKEFQKPKYSKKKFCSLKCNYEYKNEHNVKIKHVNNCRCEACGKEFYCSLGNLKRGGGKFCSRDCYHKCNGPKVRSNNCVCTYCGKEFFKQPNRISKCLNNFCSKVCADKYLKITAKHVQNNCKCVTCGKEFHRSRSYIMKNKGHFCSRKCVDEARHGKTKSHVNNCICIYCGESFFMIPSLIPKRKILCSQECKEKWKELQKLKIKCGVCGKSFFASPAVDYKWKQILCSRECQEKWDSLHEIKKCEFCGELFETPSGIKTRQFGYCSSKCYRSAHKKIKKICKTCGKEFYLVPSVISKGNGTYCSKKCRAKDILAEGNPNWCGGTSFKRYCPKFNENLKQRVRAYFGYRCAICGKTTKENGRELDVHHIEYNKNACCDNAPVQFAALCQGCHTRTTPKTNREYWEEILHDLIETKYNGKSYYTKEEWEKINKK